MAGKALKTVNAEPARNVQRAHVVHDVHMRASTANLPAVMPQGRDVAAIPDGAVALPMPIENARELVTSFYGRLDHLEAEIATLNAEKSSAKRMMREAGFDTKLLDEIRKEMRLDPTARAIKLGMHGLYWSLVADLAAEPAEEDAA